MKEGCDLVIIPRLYITLNAFSIGTVYITPAMESWCFLSGFKVNKWPWDKSRTLFGLDLEDRLHWGSHSQVTGHGDVQDQFHGHSAYGFMGTDPVHHHGLYLAHVNPHGVFLLDHNPHNILRYFSTPYYMAFNMTDFVNIMIYI